VRASGHPARQAARAAEAAALSRAAAPLSAALPADFESWDDCEVDEDDFNRFREQTAVEILGTCQQLLHAEFIGAIRTTAAAGSWQQLEVAFFVLRGLHVEIKATLSQEADGAALAPSLLQAHKQAVKALLLDLFSPLATGRLESQPAPLLASGVRLVGAFAKWLATEQPTLLEGCVRYVIGALSTPAAAEHASEAFRSLCFNCRKQLADLHKVRALLEACQSTLRSADVPIEMRVALTEGLARLVASIINPDDARAGLDQLISSPCTILQATLQQLPPGAPPPPDAAVIVAAQLTLISSSIRFCDSFRPDRHPVLPVLQGIWPLLQTAAAFFRAHADVVQALCDLYCKAMTCLKQQLAPLLPQLLMQLGEAFSNTPVVGCLSCVTQAIQMYGRDHAESEVGDALRGIMTGFIERLCGYINASTDSESQPELLTHFWEMCHRCLVFEPGLLLQLPCSTQLFETAIACICHQEFQHTRAVLTFLCLFMSGTESAGPFRETVLMAMQENGAWLLKQSLTGLSSVSPENLVDHQVELMRVLIEACHGPAQSWLLSIINDPGFHCGAVDPKGATMQAFARLILQQPALSTGEFQCVVSDFSRICRGKLSADSLSRYEKPR